MEGVSVSTGDGRVEDAGRGCSKVMDKGQSCGGQTGQGPSPTSSGDTVEMEEVIRSIWSLPATPRDLGKAPSSQVYAAISLSLLEEALGSSSLRPLPLPLSLSRSSGPVPGVPPILPQVKLSKDGLDAGQAHGLLYKWG